MFVQLWTSEAKAESHVHTVDDDVPDHVCADYVNYKFAEHLKEQFDILCF